MTAAEKILRKQVAASPLDSAGWARVQSGIRDRAFFSATVENVRFLTRARNMCSELAAGNRSASEIRRDLRQILDDSGYVPPEGGNPIQNLASRRRLDLIIDTNVQQARGWKQWQEGMSPGAIAAFPAQRLVRVRNRAMPRNWPMRWREAAQKVGWQGVSRDGIDMVALKSSPIWTAISAFGNPYPPYDFNSGMGVEDVSKRRAREYGLLDGDETIEREVQKARENPPPTFNDNLQASVNDGDEADMFKRAFGDQVTLDGGVAKWNDHAVEDAARFGSPLDLGNGVVVAPESLEGVPEDLLSLIPSLVRGAVGGIGLIELLTGGVLKADLIHGKWSFNYDHS